MTIRQQTFLIRSELRARGIHSDFYSDLYKSGNRRRVFKTNYRDPAMLEEVIETVERCGVPSGWKVERAKMCWWDNGQEPQRFYIVLRTKETPPQWAFR